MIPSKKILAGLWLTTSLLMAASAGAQKIVGQARYSTSGPLEISFVAGTESGGNTYALCTAGRSAPFQSGPAITEKFDTNGNLIWKDIYTAPPNSEIVPKFVGATNGGQVFVAGYIQNDVTRVKTVFLRAINSSGNVLWSILDASAPDVLGLKLDSLGNPMVLEAASGGMTLVKFDANSNTKLWSKLQSYGVSENAFIFFASDGAGNSYLMIGTDNFTNQLVKFNETTGDPKWHVSFARSDFPILTPTDGVVMPTGDLVVTGLGQDSGLTYTVVTLDRVSAATGNPLFHKSLGAATAGTVLGALGSTVADGSGNIYAGVTQAFNSAPFRTNSIVKFTPTGGQIFTAQLPATYVSALMTPAAAGGIFVAPSAGSVARTFRLINSVGNTVWSTSADSQFLGAGGRLAVDASNNLSYVNTTSNTLGSIGLGLLKLSSGSGAVSYDLRQKPIGILDSSIDKVAGHDASGNTYVVGREDLSVFASKLSPTGAVVWKTSIGLLSHYFTNGQVTAATYSPSSGLLALTVQTSSGVGVAQVDSTGHIKWTTEFNPTSNILVGSLAIDSLGNVDMGSEGLNGLTLTVDQFSGSGQHVWAKSYAVATSRGAISIDSLDNVYASGTTSSMSGWLTAKISRDGTQQFSTNISGNAQPVYSTRILCEPTSGDVFLAAADAASINSVATGCIRVIRLNSGGSVLWSTLVPFAGYSEPQNFRLKYSSSLSSVIVAGTISHAGDQSQNLFAARIDGATGMAVWSNALVESALLGQENTFDLDQFGNVVVASTTLLDNAKWKCKFLKLDHSTGAVRFSTSSQGQYTSPFNFLFDISCGPDNQPMVFGQTSSAWGPGIKNGLMVKYASAPVCTNRTFIARKNVTLNGSVATNNEDAGGSVYTVIAGPSRATSFSLSPNGSFTYLANSVSGTDTFTFQATNAIGQSNIAKVSIILAK